MRVLTEDESKAVKFLEKKLYAAIQQRNLDEAEKAASYLQETLRNANQETRLMKYKVVLFEFYIDLGYYANAEGGLIGVIKKVRKSTRIRLEAQSLLAVCYIRQGDLSKAEPIIQEVLNDDRYIKSPLKRFKFRKEIIERFNEEVIFIAIKKSNTTVISVEDLKHQVEVQSNLPEEKLYELLGNSIPVDHMSVFVKLDTFARKQLPTGERLQLPSPISVSNKEEIGKKVFSSLKRTFYNSLCDTKSEFYKTWSKGLTRLSSGASIIDAIYSVIKGIGVNVTIFISPFVALILRFGVEWYCTYKKPNSILDLR
jgi:tetratricopeptide (TPR) repeat protein